MASKITDSLDNIKDCIDNQKSFILEAGAGSGKTWTLIQSLRYILEKKGKYLERESKQIACITYTNVAKDEIIERIDHNPLVYVSTIHEFLWLTIKTHQNELRKEIISFNLSDPKKTIPDLESIIEKRNIDYSLYGRNFERGQLTHEDIIEFSHRLFLKYPKICRIVGDRFPYLFVDEYQDTEPRTLEIILNALLTHNEGKLTVGFFGDFMQKIYNSGIGRIESEKLITITKNDNYRCSKKVIELLAHIRPELKQRPSGKNHNGEISFILNTNGDEKAFERVLHFLEHSKSWDIKNKTKILFLTHKGIATRLGYENLMACYDTNMSFGRDRLLTKDELFCDFFLNVVESIIKFYQDHNYSQLIRLLGKNGKRLNSHQDKIKIDQFIVGLKEVRNTGSIKDLLSYIETSGLITKPQRMIDFEKDIKGKELDEKLAKKKKFYDSLMNIAYKEFVLINEFIEDATPFSTKHGVKGAEFENVLVVIDDGSWNQFKFNDVFANSTSNTDRYNRTLNLLYVCCSRAKDKLAILSLSQMDLAAISTITKWFKSENVIDLAKL